MSHYFLCSQNKYSNNLRLFQMTTAKQNQKFPFHFFFRFAVEGWGEETREKCKEIFWFLHTRVRERVRGAFSPNQDLTQNTFELRPICSANFRNSKLGKKESRRGAPSVLYSPREIPNLKGRATPSVAHSFANTIL